MGTLVFTTRTSVVGDPPLRGEYLRVEVEPISQCVRLPDDYDRITAGGADALARNISASVPRALDAQILDQINGVIAARHAEREAQRQRKQAILQEGAELGIGGILSSLAEISHPDFDKEKTHDS